MAVADATPTKTKKRNKLQNITEQRVLKKGLLDLHQRISLPTDTSELLSFPKRKAGGPLMMKQSWYERLLSDRLELKSSPAQDVSAAQSDLKYLTLPQLLAIRSQTLDFSTESQSHSAHNSFLETLDKYMFEKLALRVVQGLDDPASPQSPSGARSVNQKLYSMGLRVTLILGAIKEFEEDECVLPICWADQVDPKLWDGMHLMLFHSGELWVRCFETQTTEFAELAGGPVTIICYDGSSGQGPTRQLYWEVQPVDSSSCDLLAEILKAHQKGGLNANGLVELKMTLEERQKKERSTGAFTAPLKKKDTQDGGYGPSHGPKQGVISAEMLQPALKPGFRTSLPTVALPPASDQPAGPASEGRQRERTPSPEVDEGRAQSPKERYLATLKAKENLGSPRSPSPSAAVPGRSNRTRIGTAPANAQEAAAVVTAGEAESAAEEWFAAKAAAARTSVSNGAGTEAEVAIEAVVSTPTAETKITSDAVASEPAVESKTVEDLPLDPPMSPRHYHNHNFWQVDHNTAYTLEPLGDGIDPDDL